MPDRVSCLVWTLSCIAVFSGPVCAFQDNVPNEPVFSIAPETRSFRDLLALLSSRSRVALVAEGVPLKKELTEEETARLSKKNAPLSALVEEIAAAFDYDARRKGNVFLLKKRYTRPDDLPGITLEECRQTFRDILRVTAVLNPRVPGASAGTGLRDPLVGELIRSLTPEQRELMKARRLPVSTLSQGQQALVWRMALFFYVQSTAEEAGALLRQVEQATDARTTYGWDTPKGIRTFGYEVAEESPLLQRFKPMGQPRPPEPGAAVQPDPTAPSPSEIERVRELSQDAATLATVIAALQSRKDSAARMRVDAALAAKPVTVVGTDFAPAAEIFSALSEVYGLFSWTDKDGTLRITRPAIAGATKPGSLPAALRRAVPEPFVRALHTSALKKLTAPSVTSSAKPSDSPSGEGGGKPVPRAPEQIAAEVRAGQEKYKQIMALMDLPRTFLSGAVRRLRAGVEPKLTNTPNGRVPLTGLDQTDRGALANYFLAKAFTKLRIVTDEEPPPYIRRFDQVHLAGGLEVNNGKRYFGVGLAVPDQDGGRMEVWVSRAIPLREEP